MFEHLRDSEAEPGVRAGFEVESGGTDAWHVGEQADRRMRRVAGGRGIRIDHRALQVKEAHLRHYDLVIAMDRSNRAALRRLAARVPGTEGKIRLLREWEPDGPVEADVPDPYYGGERGFEEVVDIAERCCRQLLQDLTDEA